MTDWLPICLIFFSLYLIRKYLNDKRNTGVYQRFCITPPALYLCRWKRHLCYRELPDQRETGGTDFHQKVWLNKYLVQWCAFVQEVSLPALCTLSRANILSSASVLQRGIQTFSLIFLLMLSVMFPFCCLVLTASMIICSICHIHTHKQTHIAACVIDEPFKSEYGAHCLTFSICICVTFYIWRIGLGLGLFMIKPWTHTCIQMQL